MSDQSFFKSVDTSYSNVATKKTSKHVEGDANITFIAGRN